ncbi:TRAP transporter substrate-binding protein DctP [Chloroflexota bacterium]
MKRRNYIQLIAAVGLVTVMVVAIGTSCAAPAVAPDTAPTSETQPAAEVFTWRVQAAFAPVQTADLIRPWLDSIEAASGGRMIFDLYSGGELVPDEQVVQAAQQGSIDMIMMCSPQMAVPVDIADLDASQAFAWDNAMEIVTLSYAKGLNEIFAESYEELGDIKVLGAWVTDPGHLLTSKPITSYEDLNGLKISGHKNLTYPLVAAGASAVMLPFEEFYLAGQTGVLDGLCWCGATEAYTNGWYEVFPYMLDPPIMGGFRGVWCINEDAWEELPNDLQAIVEMSMWENMARKLVYYYDGEIRYREAFTITTLPDEDWDRLKATAYARWDEEAEKSPRAAEAVQIIKDYRAELEAAK